jgi:hypothetical protein
MMGATMDVITENERVRRREHTRDVHSALKSGMSLEEFQRARAARIERWCELFHAEMQKAHTDDPCEVLPTVLAKVEESAIVAARAVAKREAEEHVKAMLRKAIA